jgi:hypothetical protein
MTTILEVRSTSIRPTLEAWSLLSDGLIAHATQASHHGLASTAIKVSLLCVSVIFILFLLSTLDCRIFASCFALRLYLITCLFFYLSFALSFCFLPSSCFLLYLCFLLPFSLNTSCLVFPHIRLPCLPCLACLPFPRPEFTLFPSLSIIVRLLCFLLDFVHFVLRRHRA